MKTSLSGKILAVCLTQGVLYVILFIAIPHLMMRAVDDWIWISAVVLSAVIICRYAVVALVPKLRYWLFGMPILWGLILLYHPKDVYGISDGVFGLDLFPSYIDALIFSMGIFLLQCINKIIWALKNKI